MQFFKSVEFDDRAPGVKVSVQASFSLACLFVHDDPGEQIYCREKMMKIENEGYLYPMTYKKRLSDAWGVDLTHWWLPDDKGLTPMLRKVREFAAYRTQQKTDSLSQDLRDIAGIFKDLSLEGKSPKSSQSPQSQT